MMRLKWLKVETSDVRQHKHKNRETFLKEQSQGVGGERQMGEERQQQQKSNTHAARELEKFI